VESVPASPINSTFAPARASDTADHLRAAEQDVDHRLAHAVDRPPVRGKARRRPQRRHRSQQRHDHYPGQPSAARHVSHSVSHFAQFFGPVPQGHFLNHYKYNKILSAPLDVPPQKAVAGENATIS
jgi:hypothetical protein